MWGLTGHTFHLHGKLTICGIVMFTTKHAVKKPNTITSLIKKSFTTKSQSVLKIWTFFDKI